MNINQMMLRDAGHREQAFVQRQIDEKLLPKGVTFEDLLSHAVYDASLDEVLFTVRGVAYRWRVRPPE